MSESNSLVTPGETVQTHPWSRYVALGDSFTEGIGDPEPGSPGGFRGWADRVAEELGRGHADFAYANLAIRGRLLQQIVDEQVGPCLELKPDLVSISAGGNDLIRPGGDPDLLANKLDAAVQELSSGGATVVLFNGPDTASSVLGRIRGKVAIYNENLRTVAARHDAVVADMWSLRQLADPQMWDVDRLHLTAEGHRRVAEAVWQRLGYDPEDTEWRTPMPATVPPGWITRRVTDARFARQHLLPWIGRRLTGRSSGDGLPAKRPELLPYEGPARRA